MFTPPAIGAGPASRNANPAPVQPSLQPIWSGKHVPELEGLRGLAAMLVMLYHFTIYGGMRPTTGLDVAYYRVVENGWCGVDLFFVLSGFLITGILLDAKGRTGYFRNFYARRALRIFPLYYGVLIAVFWILPGLARPSLSFQQEMQTQAWYWTYLVNVHIARDGWGDFLGLGHFWSLAVEEQFYLIWPAVVFLISRRTLLQLCIALIVVGLLVRIGFTLTESPLASYVLMPARMDALAIGAMLASAVRDPAAWAVVRRWAPMVGIAAVEVLALLMLRRGELSLDSRQVQTIGFTLTAVLSGVLLISTIAGTSRNPFRRTLRSRAFRFFGRYSYGLYVFHHLLVFAIAEKALSVNRLPRVAGSQLPGQVLFILVATGASLALALLSWYCWEQPFLRLKRLFPYQRA